MIYLPDMCRGDPGCLACTGPQRNVFAEVYVCPRPIRDMSAVLEPDGSLWPVLFLPT